MSQYPKMESRPAIDYIVIYYPDIIVQNLNIIKYIAILFLLLLLFGYWIKTISLVLSFLLCNLGILRATADVSFSTQIYFVSGMFLMFLSIYASEQNLKIMEILKGYENKKITIKRESVVSYDTAPMGVFLLLLSFLYLGSGIGKLAKGGTEWAAAYNLGRHIFAPQMGYSPTLASFVLNNDWILTISAVVTVVLEIGFIFAILYSKKLVFSMFVAFIIAFHVGIALVMGPVFIYNIVFLLMLLDWENIKIVRNRFLFN